MRDLQGWMKKGLAWYDSFWLTGQQDIYLPAEPWSVLQ